MKNKAKSPAKSKAKLGQNFLVDEQAQRRIAEALGQPGRGIVVEIGPGKAAITALLAERAARLVAIEVDPLLAGELRQRFVANPQVEVMERDVLAVDFSTLAPDGGARAIAVVGNLPYYITSPILQHLFAQEHLLSRAVVMVQREVAERMTAEPGTRAYGALSVLCQIHADLQLLFDLPPGAFSPPPEVHSSVVRLEFRPRWAELGVERGPFLGFVRACFAQKRKTLNNNLRAAAYPEDAISGALGALGNARAEELSIRELAGVFLSLGTSRLEVLAGDDL